MTVGELALTEAEHQRVAIVDGLVALGGEGVDGLLVALSDTSWTVRRAVVAGLAALGDEAAPALVAWLRDARTSEHAIAAAVDALATSIGPATSDAVAGLLDHPQPAVVADAASILGRRHAAGAAPALARLLEHADDNVAVAAMEALGTIGGGVEIGALVALVRQRNFFRTFPALQILARGDDPRAIAPIAELLDDALLHDEAVRALGRTGSPLAVAPLVSALAADGLEPVRLVALALADALVRATWTGADVALCVAIRRELGSSSDRLLAALPGATAAERVALVRILGCLGDGAAFAPLIALVDEPATRVAALAAIRAIAHADADALLDALDHGDAATRLALLPSVGITRAAPRLQALLNDDDPEVRARACAALARIGDRAAVPALFRLLGDGSARVGHAAAAAIHALGALETPDLTRAALASDDPVVRRQAVRIIAYFGWPETLDAVRAAIADRDPRVAELAVSALAVHDHPDVDALLVELAAAPVEGLRAAAMRVAGQRSGDRMEALLAGGTDDPSAWVRYYACQGLGRFGRAGSLPILIARLADEQPQVRVAAIEALSHLDTPEALAALTAAARSLDVDAQRAALIGIGHAADPSALALLLEAARAPDVATRLIALSGLARRAEPAALDELAAVALGDQPDLADAALSILAERTDARAAELLVTAAIVSPADHPVHAALSGPSPSRVNAIAERLVLADERAAPVLAAALARMRTPEALAALADGLGARSAAARRSAALTLLMVAPEAARTAVARLATEDPDPEVRRACRAALDSTPS